MSGAVDNRVAVLHGVNLDAIGRREPEHYGTLSFGELETQIRRWAREASLEAGMFSTNHEGEMVEHLHRVPDMADAILINAGAWTHYSWAIRDALEVAGLPTVEIHLSDVMAREQWRRHSVFEGLVLDVVSGEGPDGYKRALGILKAELSG